MPLWMHWWMPSRTGWTWTFGTSCLRGRRGIRCSWSNCSATCKTRGDLVQDSQGKWMPTATLNWEALPARVEGVIEERIARLEEMYAKR